MFRLICLGRRWMAGSPLLSGVRKLWRELVEPTEQQPVERRREDAVAGAARF